MTDNSGRWTGKQAYRQTDRHNPATQTKLYTPLLFFVAVQTIHGGLHVRLVGRWGVAGIAHLTGRQCANVNSLEFRQVYVQIHTHNIQKQKNFKSEHSHAKCLWLWLQLQLRLQHCPIGSLLGHLICLLTRRPVSAQLKPNERQLESRKFPWSCHAFVSPSASSSSQ